MKEAEEMFLVKLVPNQMRYQAALRPELLFTWFIKDTLALWKRHY